MKVENIEHCQYTQMTIDGTEYRRHSANSWEYLIGNSWEPCWDEHPFEQAYQDSIQISNINLKEAKEDGTRDTP